MPNGWGDKLMHHGLGFILTVRSWPLPSFLTYIEKFQLWHSLQFKVC
jgi:hypothetical protein